MGNNSDLRRGERMASLLMHLLSNPTRWYTVGTLLESLGLDEQILYSFAVHCSHGWLCWLILF